ncbi:MAG: hypothetical protein A2Y33_07955 [Spirochaetes bacterium GWF1_51_8]|nr:MAG: hypothetical protein A2Y33_07955 [Spirochaetes bacterium GWF1_51_8]
MGTIRRNPYETRIVVTGLGTINPLGNTVREFWDNLKIGKTGIRLSQRYAKELENFPVKIAGEVDYPANITDYIQKKMLNRFGRYAIFAHVAATQAYRDTGITKEEVEIDPTRYGAIIGTGEAGLGMHWDAFINMREYGLDHTSPFYVVGVIPNTPPGYFAKENNFQGPNFSVNSACASSNHAIGNAAMMIRMGMADVMMAGGTEAVVILPGFSGFNAIFALSRRSDSPETASRPFDKDRDGFVLAEGSGIICLEELEHAKKRGAKIYAELKGFGFSCDAYDLVAPHPDGKGGAGAILNALEDAQIDKSQVELINAHGTSTQLGDLTESRGINRVFGEKTMDVMVQSTKSMTGHLIGAAGGIEAIATIMAFEEGVIHPSVNVFEQDPEIHLNVVKNRAIEKKIKVALSNSFGFGGQNSSIVLTRYEG